MSYSVIVEAELSADDMVVGTFRARITFDWVEGCGDGWNEPHEEARPEFCSAQQVDGNWLNQKQLNEWASEWLAQIDDLDAIMDRDRSTIEEQMAAQRAMYARQGLRLPSAQVAA